MCLGKKKTVNLKVIRIDVKDFPMVSQLPHAPSISEDTLDIVRGRLQRHRGEFRGTYNHLHELVPVSLRNDEEVDAAAIALHGSIPVTTEYMRLNETLKNLEQISQSVQGDQAVYWMGVNATFGGSTSSRVLTSSVKEGTKSFSWVGSDLQSNMSLPVKKSFPLSFHNSASVQERRPLRFFLSHHWKPRDEWTISSGERIASTLAYAELPLENICFGGRPRVLREDLPLVINGRKLTGVSGENPQMSLEISISLDR